MMPEKTDGSGGGCGDGAEKIQELFKKYNKKFNRGLRDEDKMEFRSFKHITSDITTLGNIRRDDRYSVFNKFTSEQPSPRVMPFERFGGAIRNLADLEVQYQQRKKNGSETPTVDDVNKKAMEEITTLQPNNVQQWFKSLLNSIVEGEASISKVSSLSGNALKVIGKTALDDLVHVGTAVSWIGPAVRIIQVIWNRIVAFEEITDDLVKFSDTLSYLTDTVEFIEESKLYHTNMMERRMEGLTRVLKRAEKLFDDVEKHGKSKVKRFFTARENQKRLKDMDDDLTKWIGQTYFVQLAENQEVTNELKVQMEALRNDLNAFMNENEENWVALRQKLALFMFTPQQDVVSETHEASGDGDCFDTSDCAVPPQFENARQTQTARVTTNQFVADLPPELHKTNSDFLIYHAYEDKDIACAIRDELLAKVTKFRVNGNIETVRIHVLDDFHTIGVQQERLEAALKLCSVKLLLVTRRFVELKRTQTHPLEIFSILERSRSGQVFALRYDPDYGSYLRELDLYVQGLVQGCFYDPRGEDFPKKITDLFKMNLQARMNRDAELEKKREAERAMQERIRRMKEERLARQLRQQREDIERELDRPDITDGEMEELLEQLRNL